MTRLNFCTLFNNKSPCLMVDWGREPDNMVSRDCHMTPHLILKVLAIGPHGNHHTPNLVDLTVEPPGRDELGQLSVDELD